MGNSTITLQQEKTVVMEGSKYVHETFSRPQIQNHRAKLKEAYSLFNRAMKGSPRAMLDLREAFSTSDFPILFGDILSRELLPQYQVTPAMWPAFARRTTVRDFRPHKLVDLLGGQGLLEIVPELDEYPARSLDEAEYSLRVRKHGARLALSWESFINDDLGGLQNLPNRLAVSARRSEDHGATSLITGASGPVALDFWGAHGDYSNLYAGNPQLSTDSLSEGLRLIQTRRDEDDAPVIIDGFVLMVPPALEVTANNILNAQQLRFTDGDGNEVIVGNWLNGRVTLVVNPWLPVVDQSANASTTWYILPVPSAPRPAVVQGFLTGNEVPDLRLRSSDSQRVGGGDVPPEEGSFDNDDVQYRVRHVFGGATVDPFATLVSLGTDV